MQNKKEIWFDKLISRKNILLIILFVLFILFLESTWDFYNQKVVDGILSKIKSHWLIDTTLILLAIFTLISTIYFIRTKKRASNYVFVFGLFLFLLFFYSRLFSDKYSYEPYYWFPQLNYIDYLFLLFGSIFLIKLWNWINKNKEPIYNNVPFLLDKPLEPGDIDKFGRKEFATKIATKIQSKLKVEDAGALAIGINGSWGSGKTSFTNMIKEQIDKENRIVIDFNPWRSSSASKIIEDFFELLISELKPHDPELSSSITSYAKSLTKIEENLIPKAVESVSEILFEDLNKNEAYDSINDSIKTIKKQIIIFIDDLDRLDKKEIIEVLRIIRNTANFNNVVYVVSYDKGYILTAIKDFNEYNFKSFLEKIFQFEFTLPMYEHGVLRTEIKKLLKEGLEETFYKQIDRVVDSKEFYGVNFTNEVVKTYRDVIRLVNSLLFEIESIKDEVFFYDFYLLQLLKLDFPKIYEALINNRNLFFTTDGEKGLYRFKMENEAWTSEDVLSFGRAFNNDAYNQQHKEEESVTSIEKYLANIQKELELTEYDKSLINYLLKTLLELKETKKEGEDLDLYKSFAYPANFHKYFSFRLYEGDISAKEFEKFRRKDFDEYKLKVQGWIAQGKYSALIDRLEKVDYFSTVHEFENHILILFEIGRLQIVDETNNHYWIDCSLTIKNLIYPKPNQKITRLYSDPEDYKKFLLNLFNTATKPQLYESLVISRLINGISARNIVFVLNTKELSDINFGFLKEYCETHNEITHELGQLFNNSLEQDEEYPNETKKRNDSIELYRSYYKLNLTTSELNTFIRHDVPGYDYFIIPKDWLFMIFESWEGFEQYFKSSEKLRKDKKCYEEFLRFYEKTKANNYSAVEFFFEHLKVDKIT